MAGFVGGTILGPFMPIDTFISQEQEMVNWLIRLGLFIFIGGLIGYVTHALKKSNYKLQVKIEKSSQMYEQFRD